MSLSGSISNALSGLRATSHAAQIVSSNLSNAMNDNYTARRLELVADGISNSGGVKIAGITRHADPVLIADRRQANSELALARKQSDALGALEALVGTPDDATSLSARLTQFDSALRFAESTPGSDVRLREVAASATMLVETLQSSQSQIQQQRTRADREIAGAVTTLNQGLQNVVQLNSQIVSAQIRGLDTSQLLDQRQAAVDAISEIVGVREMPRERGAISLVTKTGLLLVEDTAMQFDFAATNVILPHMSASNGMLGQITHDGETFGTSGGIPDLSGGRLQGLFEQRDTLAPAAQEQFDTLALDLAERFNDLPADTTLGPGGPALFTDAGARADAANLVGLAGRIELNTSVAQGEVWRVRDGLNAAAPGAEGNAAVLSDMLARLSESRLPSGGSIFESAANASSIIAQQTASAEQRTSFANARFQQLEELRLEMGVDTDAELQRLLVIETNYAANARMIQTVDEMLNSILRITS